VTSSTQRRLPNNKTLTRDRHPCLRRDWNPQSQQRAAVDPCLRHWQPFATQTFSKFCHTSTAAYVRGSALVLVPSLAAKINVVGFPHYRVMDRFCDEKSRRFSNKTEIICAVLAISLHLCWVSAKKGVCKVTGTFIKTSWCEVGFLKWPTKVCKMQFPVRNCNATIWLFQCLAPHFAHCTASPFCWTASRPRQCLDANCVIHFTLRVARSLLSAAQRQEQCKVYKQGPTPALWKSQLKF
jgi:hypothetical protein